MSSSIKLFSPNKATWKLAEAVIFFSILYVSAWSCAQSNDRKAEEVNKMENKSIEEVQRLYEDEWLNIPGVVGVGIGECEGTPCIKIMVGNKTDSLSAHIPSQIEGFIVEIQETGEFKARSSEKE